MPVHDQCAIDCMGGANGACAGVGLVGEGGVA